MKENNLDFFYNSRLSVKRSVVILRTHTSFFLLKKKKIIIVLSAITYSAKPTEECAALAPEFIELSRLLLLVLFSRITLSIYHHCTQTILEQPASFLLNHLSLEIKYKLVKSACQVRATGHWMRVWGRSLGERTRALCGFTCNW